MSNENALNSYAGFLERMQLVGLALIVFFLPLKIHYANIAVGIAAFFWLLNIKQNVKYFNRSLLPALLIFTSLYLVNVIGLIHSDNMGVGLFSLEKKLSLFALPLVMLISPLNKKQFNIIWCVFICSTILACLYCQYKALVSMHENGLPWYSFWTDPRYQNNELTTVLPLHPAYLSLFICLLLFQLTVYFRNTQKTILRVGIPVLSLYFLVTLSQLMARAGIYSLIAVSVLIMLYTALHSKQRVLALVVSLSIVLSIMAAIWLIPELKFRVFDSVSNLEEAVTNDDQLTSTSLHVKSWYCAFNSWKDGHVIFGYGTGDEKDVLRNCYSSMGWQEMAQVGYDSHNEYLSSMVRHGIVGITLLLLSFLYPLYLSLRHNHLKYAAFIIIMMIACVSESMLRGQVSVLFYSFFNALCYIEMVRSFEVTHSENKQSSTSSTLSYVS